MISHSFPCIPPPFSHPPAKLPSTSTHEVFFLLSPPHLAGRRREGAAVRVCGCCPGSTLGSALRSGKLLPEALPFFRGGSWMNESFDVALSVLCVGIR